MKNALVHLFSNAAKHGEHGQSRLVLDRFSSATAFVGTRKPWKLPRPRTWLLGVIVLGIAARGARRKRGATC